MTFLPGFEARHVKCFGDLASTQMQSGCGFGTEQDNGRQIMMKGPRRKMTPKNGGRCLAYRPTHLTAKLDARIMQISRNITRIESKDSVMSLLNWRKDER